MTLPQRPSQLRRANFAGRFLIFAICLFGGRAYTQEKKINFARDIQPIYTGHCLECHGGVKREGGISFASRNLAMNKGL